MIGHTQMNEADQDRTWPPLFSSGTSDCIRLKNNNSKTFTFHNIFSIRVLQLRKLNLTLSLLH